MGIRWRTATAFLFLSAIAFAGAAPARARALQPVSAPEQIALGDRAYDERHASEALEHFTQALHVEPKNYEALWKASRVEVDLAESMPRGSAQDAMLTDAKTHADDAIAAKTDDAEGHFCLARAIGRKALTVGTMDRIKYSKIVRLEALEALKFDSTHAGALHVLGMWNAEIMRVNGLARAFARTFLGAGVFSLASWDEAQRLLEASVRIDPDRIVHHLDLGMIYADRGNRSKALEQFEWIARAPVREFNDELYKKQAAARQRTL
jgi:tetratricopeptide (TPR) repeat protein